MAHVLTLAYRPRVWEELVGNEIYVTMLRNSVVRNDIKHGYFVSGTRGSGKTTAVRIFAKAIQCEQSSNGNPCNLCKTCRDIDRDVCPDVLEIDAASENKVESIRALIQGLHYTPSCRKKVVILDEVHALSNAAANVLLKTLEEPPEHVVFMFCTTDPEKVLDTIISRCLRFDFRRIQSADIAARLKKIAKEEMIDAEDAALETIAEAVNGGMRDAITILDQAQLLAAKVTVQTVQDIIGFVPYNEVYQLFEHVAAKAYDRAADWAETVTSQKSHTDTLLSLLHFLEALSLMAAGAKTPRKVPQDFVDKTKQMAAQFDMKTILDMADIVRQAIADLRRRAAGDPKTLVLLAVLGVVAAAQGHQPGQARRTLKQMVEESTRAVTLAKRNTTIRKYFDGEILSIVNQAEKEPDPPAETAET